MSLFSRILKKLRRRTRQKGVVAAAMARPGRNYHGVTAQQLWERSFMFRETPALKAGMKRRIARERAARKSRKFKFF